MNRRNFITMLGIWGMTFAVVLSAGRVPGEPQEGPVKTQPTGKRKPQPINTNARPQRVPSENQPESLDGGTRGTRYWFQMINRWFHSIFSM